MENRIIVSRHAAAVEFIAKRLGGFVHGERVYFDTLTPDRRKFLEKWAADNHDEFHGGFTTIPVVATATPENVSGRIVYGNLPLHLASLSAKVVAVEFAGAPPRGQEYDLAAMEAAGAKLVEYVIRPAADYENRLHLTREEAQQSGYCC